MKETTKYQNIHGNRKHKDSLFGKVFRKKKGLLDLYNAINGTKVPTIRIYRFEG